MFISLRPLSVALMKGDLFSSTPPGKFSLMSKPVPVITESPICTNLKIKLCFYNTPVTCLTRKQFRIEYNSRIMVLLACKIIPCVLTDVAILINISVQSNNMRMKHVSHCYPCSAEVASGHVCLTARSCTSRPHLILPKQ